MTVSLLEHFYKLGSPDWVNSGRMKCWPLLSFPFLTSPDTVRHTGSGVMPCSDRPVDPHTVSTQLGHMTLVVWSVWTLQTNDPKCLPMSEGFSNLPPAENMWHWSFFFFFFWPDSPTLILLSCERREEEKERWECQRGGTQQLRVINHCHGGGRDERDERHERWSAADMAGISLQRWDESTYSAAFAFVADMRLWHHILPETERWRCSESVKQERPCKKEKKGRGSECIALWHMDCALNYCQSSSSQRLWISHEELCIVKMFRVQRERQLIRPNVHMHT